MPETPVPILPYDIIKEIIKRLPLQDLLHGIWPIRCWRLILQRELNRRHTLFLTPYDSLSRWDYPNREMLDHVCRDDGPAWPETLPTCAVPNEAQLKFAYVPINDAMMATLRRNPLPNITNLTLQHFDVNMERYRGIIRLIRLWSPKLISLRLDLHFEVNGRRSKIKRNLGKMILAFFEALNDIPTLQHLYLHLSCPSDRNYYEFVSLPDNLRFSFLSHLYTFCFKTSRIDRAIKCLFVSLHEHAIANEHLRICLHHDNEPLLAMEKVVRFGPELNRKFTRIETHYSFVEEVDEVVSLLSFCTQFSSLSRLTLHTQPYMMAELSQHLRLLTSLFSLELSFGYGNNPHSTHFVRRGHEEEPEQEYSQVPSVRVFRSQISTESHVNIAKLHLADIFPNLQVVQLEHTSSVCSQCDYDITDIKREDQLDGELRDRVIECMRLARQPFRACSNLRKIEFAHDTYYSVSSQLISDDEL